MAIIEDDGDVIERYEYDAYGAVSHFDPDFTAFSGTDSGNVIAFAGQRLDRLDGGNLLIMYYKNHIYVIALWAASPSAIRWG